MQRMMTRGIGAIAVLLVLTAGLPLLHASAAAPGSLNYMGAGQLFADPGTPADHVVMIFEGRLDTTAVPDATDFEITVTVPVPEASATPIPTEPIPSSDPPPPTSVTVNPTAVSIPYATYSGDISVVRLDLPLLVSTTDVVTLSYTPGSHPLRDVTGTTSLETLVNEAVEFVVYPTFEPVGAIVDEGIGPSHVVVILTHPLTTGPLPPPADFIVEVTRALDASASPEPPMPVTPISVNSILQGFAIGFLDLELPLDIGQGDMVMVTYTADSTPLLDLAGTNTAGSFSVSAGVSLAETPTRGTPAGSNVTVAPADSTTGAQPVDITFSTVTADGTTTVTSSTSGPDVPAGFQVGDPPLFYDIATTAAFGGQIQVCVKYVEVDLTLPESSLRLLHFEAGAWVDITTSVDTGADRVCGITTSLSPFAIATYTYPFDGFASPVQNPPIVNIVRAGATVPVKWGVGPVAAGTALAAGSPSSSRIDCATGAVIAGTTVAAGSPRAQAGGRFHLDWRTDRSWVGTCRRLTVALSDGSTHVAEFSFR